MHYKLEIIVYSARKPVIRREIAGPTKNEGRKIQTGRQKIRTGNQFPALTLEKKDRYHVIAEVRGRTQGGKMNTKIKEVDIWRKWQ